MRIKPIIAAVTAGMAVFLTGCEPKYASEKEIMEYADKVSCNEHIELDSKVDEHRYRFRSKDRDIAFEVWTKPDTISIDGSTLGYTDKYHIASDYIASVHKYNDKKVTELMEKYGFEEEARSHTFNYYESFTFVISNSQIRGDIDAVNGFLNDLRHIVEDEQNRYGAEVGPYNGSYCYRVLYKVDEGAYQRTCGNYNFDSYIVPGEAIDILKDLRYSDQLLANAVPPVRNGILIYVETDMP